MTPTQALNELKSRIPPGTPLVAALEQFIRFYSDTEIDDCPKASEGDMLLFQWGGPYSWDTCFSVNLTRQFSFDDEDGEYDRMQQLQMNCRYQAGQIAIAPGNEWLYGADTEAFLQKILVAPCVITAKNLNMQSLDFDLHDV
jgi:hypothetical protein